MDHVHCFSRDLTQVVLKIHFPSSIPTPWIACEGVFQPSLRVSPFGMPSSGIMGTRKGFPKFLSSPTKKLKNEP